MTTRATKESQHLRFRIVHLLYLLTLLGSALATFGAVGAIAPILVGVFWLTILTCRSRPQAFRNALLIAMACYFLFGVFPYAMQPARSGAPQPRCTMNLKMIALALHNYHEFYGALPPAFVADENGKPMHSWRVLILPFLSEQPLYDQYDFNEPWNGPNNRKLLERMPSVFCCPASSAGGRTQHPFTSYVAVVGPSTAWPGKSSIRFSEIRDGLSNTLLLMEYNNETIPWLKPEDLDVRETARLSLAEAPGYHDYGGFFFHKGSGWAIALADGTIRFIESRIKPSAWSAMIGVDDRIAWHDEDIYGSDGVSTARVKWDNCLRALICLVLAFLPLPWVWLNPASPDREASAADRRD